MYYFELIPDELILIIIEYIDLTNKNSDNSLTITLNGLLSISNRYEELYDYYMDSINNGYINNFKILKLNDVLPLVHQRNYKYVKIVEDYNKQMDDYYIREFSNTQLIRITELNRKLYNFVLNANSIFYLIHYNMQRQFSGNITITLKLIVYFNNNYYYMTHRSFWNGEHGYREYNIIKYNTWKELIIKIPYKVLKILYNQNNYDRIPEDNGRIADNLITYK